MWSGDMMSWGVFSVIHMVLLWFLIIFGIAALAKWLFSGGNRATRDRSSEEDPALAILRERYARGEIDKAEFEARKRDLAH